MGVGGLDFFAVVKKNLKYIFSLNHTSWGDKKMLCSLRKKRQKQFALVAFFKKSDKSELL